MMRVLVVLFALSVPSIVSGGSVGNIQNNASFLANGNLATFQNLGNGNFTNGNKVNSVDIRASSTVGNLIRPEVRAFDANGNIVGSHEVGAYSGTVSGDFIYHFQFLEPFVPNPSYCYVLLFYHFNTSPNTTFYGWTNDEYVTDSTGCNAQYASDDINTGFQNPALNGHGLIDYSFLLYTEPVTTPPALFNLGQFKQYGIDLLTEGITYVGNSVRIKGFITDNDSAQVKLEVEIKSADVSFDGLNTVFSTFNSPGEVFMETRELISPALQYVSGEITESFHWRARAVDVEGNVSEWQEFGIPGNLDFTAKIVPLWTQVMSIYPSESAMWADDSFASGVDADCSPSDPSNAIVARCGCTISSLVMIARYYGIENGIDGNPVTPGNANTWLKTHGGFTPNNTVIWSKAEEYLGVLLDGYPHRRLVRNNNGFRIPLDAKLDEFLNLHKPAIAFDNRAGHYFVIDSKVSRPDNVSTYTIRDPFWYNTSTLSDSHDSLGKVHAYGNMATHATIFDKLDTATKINSHVELYLQSPAELLVIDPQGRRVGKDPVSGLVYEEVPGALYYEDESILTSEFDVDAEEIHHGKMLELPVLTDGSYEVKVIGTGSGSFTLTSIMTDEFGSTMAKTFAASTTPNAVAEYSVEVAGGKPTDTTIQESVSVTADELKGVIKQSNAKNLIKVALLLQVALFEKAYERGKIKEAKAIISALETEVKLLKKKNHISAAAADSILALLGRLKGLL